MSARLEIPELDAMGGIVRTVAVPHENGGLDVTLIGDAESIPAIARRMMRGSIDAVLDGTPIRMNHFSMLNQPSLLRLHAHILYETTRSFDQLSRQEH